VNKKGVYRYAFKAKASGAQVYRDRMPGVGVVKASTSPEQTLSVAKEALVVFRIQSGTSAGDWNTEAHTVHARVGDTLRIINDDLMTHRPHTDGHPFPNPSGSEGLDPGKSRDYVLETAYDSRPGHTLYCAIHGQSSHFWLDVVEP
jgi:plastocyanin